MIPKKLLLFLLSLALILSGTSSEVLTLLPPSSEPADNTSILTEKTSDISDTNNLTSIVDPISQDNQLAWEGTLSWRQSNEQYFYGQIMSRKGSMIIKAIDSNLQSTSIVIQKKHPLKLIDSFKNFVLLKQVQSTAQSKTSSSEDITIQKISAYYIYRFNSIEKSPKSTTQTLIPSIPLNLSNLSDSSNSSKSSDSSDSSDKSDSTNSSSPSDPSSPSNSSKPSESETQTAQNKISWLEANQQIINALTDDSSFAFPPGYVLTGILELDEPNHLLYVTMKSALIQTTVIYKIDLLNRSSTLITTAWFSNHARNIVAANSKILIDNATSQFLIYPQDQLPIIAEQTKFIKQNFSEITSLPIFKNNIAIIKFLGSFFFLSSASDDRLELNGFLYSGYGQNPISGETSITTQTFFNYFVDHYNIFIAVGSSNLLWVEVFQNTTSKQYQNSTLTLLQSVKDENDQKSILEDFKRISRVFYHDNKLYMVTSDKFLIYQNNQSRIEKVHEIALPVQPVAAEVTLIIQEVNQTVSEPVDTEKQIQTSNVEKDSKEYSAHQGNDLEGLDQKILSLFQEMEKYHDFLKKAETKQ